MAEQTFIMIKPDGVQRGLVSTHSSPIARFPHLLAFADKCLLLFCFSQIGEIISRFEKKGFYLKGNGYAPRQILFELGVDVADLCTNSGSAKD